MVTSGKHRSFIRITGRILSVLVILFLSISLIGQIFFPEWLIDVVGFRVLAVSDTGSMLPVLRHRNLMVVRKFDFESLEVGDYVTFESRAYFNGEEQNILVTHQIIEVVSDSETGAKAYRTRGINPDVGPDRQLMTVDGANKTNRFVGKYMFHISGPRDLRAFLTSTPGIIAVTINFICLVAIAILIIKDEKLAN